MCILLHNANIIFSIHLTRNKTKSLFVFSALFWLHVNPSRKLKGDRVEVMIGRYEILYVNDDRKNRISNVHD